MLDLHSFPNLLALFLKQADTYEDRPFLWRKQDGAYRPQSWRQIARTTDALIHGLQRIGVQRGDRVVLVGENRPEWLMSDLGIIGAGGVTVPAYTTNTTADHRHILNSSGAVGVIVSTPALAKIIMPAAIASPACRWLVVMDGDAPAADANLATHKWSDLAAHEPGGGSPLKAMADILQRTDVAGFIYTSGTGGAPKAVMLSHGSALANCHGARGALHPHDLSNEVFLSFLPPSHAYERTLGQFLPIALGAQIYYGEGIEHLARNIEESKPTLLACVPRMLGAMRQRIERTVERQGGWKAKLFRETHRIGCARQDGRLGFVDQLADVAFEKLVRAKFRERFGGRVKAMVCAGAALDPDDGRFFTAMGVPILQGYGQTEAGPMISANTPLSCKMHSVGRPIDGVEARIADDGEILVRGEGLMRGYWNDEASTAAAIVDGWLHTGDIGHIDGDGHLHITDRKKDIIVLSGGDNVSPARIEGVLTQCDEILQAAVFGDDRASGLTAVVVPDPEFVKTLPDQSEKAVRDAVQKAVDRANRNLALFERVRNVVFAPDPFTIDKGLMTPTLKIRRHLVRQLYLDQ